MRGGHPRVHAVSVHAKPVIVDQRIGRSLSCDGFRCAAAVTTAACILLYGLLATAPILDDRDRMLSGVDEPTANDRCRIRWVAAICRYGPGTCQKRTKDCRHHHSETPYCH